MKTDTLVSVVVTVAVIGTAGAIAFDFHPLAAFALATNALVLLVVRSDYSRRLGCPVARTRVAVPSRERMPLAA
jgi:hypothetical protein